MQDRLTVIITSSPVRSNPDTYVITRVFESFNLVPGLAECRKILICDGYVVVDESRYKRGQIRESEVKKYEEFKDRLRGFAEAGEAGFENTEVVSLTEREGFGWAVKLGCELATTPYVLIVQHDRVFMRGVDLTEVVDSMDSCSDVRYVGLRTTKTRHFAAEVQQKGKIGAHRMSFWYDSTHVCRTSFYRQLFTQRYCHYIPRTSELCTELVSTMTLGSKKPQCILRRLHTYIVKRGMFIEDTFGQLMMTHINFFQRERGNEAADRVHELYGAWLLATEDENDIVGHLNGRDYLTTCQLVEKGYVPGGYTNRSKVYKCESGDGSLPQWALDEEDSADSQWGTRLRLLAHSGDGNESIDEGTEDEQGEGEDGIGAGDSQGCATGIGEEPQLLPTGQGECGVRTA